ncbi:MAG: thioredoxin family protein [Bacteroidales bacterium]|nr:thioredoxin family protein [Bacteroidales bacterium]MDD4673001.1 thioredoxin family protein [Bacteroidales bacterium]MDY0348371.1 thioredoxin family protein [Tenuifilaceae bacterium]
MVFSKQLWDELITQHDSVLLYLSGNDCGVCGILEPKVKELMESKFPKVKLFFLDATINRELAAQLRMLSIPGIIYYADGREVFRASGLIHLSEFERKVERTYKLMFE